jgi:hypothetical protein
MNESDVKTCTDLCDDLDSLEPLQEIAKQIVNDENSLIELKYLEHDQGLQYSDIECLSLHNDQYTVLLKAYIDNFQQISVTKRVHKEEMYETSRDLLVGVPTCTFILILLLLLLVSTGKVTSIETIPEIIMAAISMIGTFIAIPKMITSYLFNKKEEETMANEIEKFKNMI